MYQSKNKIYADAGCILKYKNKTAYTFKDVDLNDVIEVKINLDDMKKDGKFIKYSTELKEYISCTEYGDWKTKIIKKQFSNDDQIAIMLNKNDSDDDLMLFNKMQEWRAWSSIVAKKIISIL